MEPVFLAGTFSEGTGGALCLLLEGVMFPEEDEGEAFEEEVEDRWRPGRLAGLSFETSLFGVSCVADPGVTRARPSLLRSLFPAASFLLFLSSVARSGLLAVPGERYIERRFVWRSLSSVAS